MTQIKYFKKKQNKKHASNTLQLTFLKIDNKKICYISCYNDVLELLTKTKHKKILQNMK